MEDNLIPLSLLKKKTTGKISSIDGGHQIKKRLHAMGIYDGTYVSVKTKQPFHGPLTIEVRGTQMTIGRGMANKIQVEVIE